MSYYTLIPHDVKKKITPEKVWVPTDAQKDTTFKSHGKAEKLTREELKEAYRKSGMVISEDELDKMYGQK